LVFLDGLVARVAEEEKAVDGVEAAQVVEEQCEAVDEVEAAQVEEEQCLLGGHASPCLAPLEERGESWCDSFLRKLLCELLEGFYVNCWKVKQGLDSVKFKYETFPDPFRRQSNPWCVIVEDLDVTFYRCNLVATTAH
jgi:hypothetical protein